MERDRLDEAQRRSDGRNVDPELGELQGEGSRQRVKHLDEPYPDIPAALEAGERPSQAGPADSAPTYYG
ncbi:MAG TPA: polysulfide reductase, partial [Archangium sp.]